MPSTSPMRPVNATSRAGRNASSKRISAVRYPILPVIESVPSKDPLCPGCIDEILHVRHHSLYVPRDFDVSPYFEVIKPSLVSGFDPHALAWHVAPGVESVASSSRGGEVSTAT